MNINKYRKRFILQDSEGEGSSGGVDQAADAFQSFLNPAAPEEKKAAPPEPTQAPVQKAQEPESQEESDEDIAARLAAEESGEQEKAPADEMLTITVDGKEVQISKADLPELYKGNLRQEDYTKKTMAAAEQRKAAEAEIQKAQQDRAHYAQELQNYLITSESILREQAQVLTQELLNSDPVEYLAQKHTFDQRQVQVQKAQEELQRLQTQYQQEQEAAQRAYQSEQLEKLHAKLPDWKDPAKAKAEGEKIRDHMMANEFSPQEIGNMADHRVLLMARKAMLYDSLMARAKEATKKVAAAPTMVERPGVPNTNSTDGRTQAMKGLKKAGTVDAAANVFAQLLS